MSFVMLIWIGLAVWMLVGLFLGRMCDFQESKREVSYGEFPARYSESSIRLAMYIVSALFGVAVLFVAVVCSVFGIKLFEDHL